MRKTSSHKTTKQHKYENGVAGRKCELAGKETGSSVINYGRRLIWPRQATLLIMRQHAALAATPINTQWAKKMYQKSTKHCQAIYSMTGWAWAGLCQRRTTRFGKKSEFPVRPSLAFWRRPMGIRVKLCNRFSSSISNTEWNDNQTMSKSFEEHPRKALFFWNRCTGTFLGRKISFKRKFHL